jgi:hypothetical protein
VSARGVLALVVVTACGKAADPPPAPAPATPVAAPMAPKMTAKFIAPKLETRFGSKRPTRKLIRDDGVGLITAKTSTETMKELYPDVTVTNDSAEDHSFDRYQVGSGSGAVLESITNNENTGFFKVTVWAKDYGTAEGISPSSTVAQLAAAYPDAACKYETYAPNAENFTSALFCTTAKYPHLGFYLDDSKWKGKPGAVAIADLAARAIDRVIWVPRVED